jgi:DNA-binding response OmpR family regulator
MTGLGSERDRKLAADAGFEVHLTKPFRPDSLEGIVNRLAAS